MKITLAEIEIVKGEKTGPCTGNWVGESKYKLTLAKEPKDNKIGYAIVDARHDIDFDEGELFYECKVAYLVTDISTRPDGQQIINRLSQCHKDLDSFYFQKGSVVVQGKAQELWTEWDRKALSLSVNEKLLRLYP